MIAAPPYGLQSRMSASRVATHGFAPSPGQSGGPPSAARQAIDRAWRHQYSDLREARAAAAEAVALAEAAGDLHDLGSAYFQSAYAAVRLGARDDAVAASAHCLRIFEELQDARGLWLARTAQAVCARLDGKPEASIQRLLELVADPPRDATPVDLFVIHIALSLTYRFVGLLEPALKWHYQVVDTARDTGDSLLIASTLCNLGGYHGDLHNPQEGCRLLEQGLEIASACGADRTTVIIALNLTQSYGALGRHTEALELAERYLPVERYTLAMGAPEPQIPLTLALAYANAGRAEDAQRTFDGVRPLLVRSQHDDGTPEVFWSYVESRIALVANRPADAARIATDTLAALDENAVDSPSDLMQLHAIAATACEIIGDDRRALFHERRRAIIRERLARLGAHVASLTHNIRSELDTTRAERDRIVTLHAELEREHARLAALNSALTAQIEENLRLHDELKEQSYRDALTGLHNRRYLYERGPRLLQASLLQVVPLCLAMIDLDNFKHLNDLHGHVVGDRVLVALGKLVREGLREGDIVCRIGGEEFAMILPTSTAAVAHERLKGILAACAHLSAAEGEDPLPAGLSFSAGIVEAPAHGGTIDTLMIAADRLLYKAKHGGRARIEVAGDPVRPFLPHISLVAREPID